MAASAISNRTGRVVYCLPAGASESSTDLVHELFGRVLRSAFFACVSLLWIAMIYYAYQARVDFGWRIFKLCGMNFERRQIYERMFRLRAWLHLDACLSLQVVVCLSVYVLPGLSRANELILATLGLSAAVSWVLLAFRAMHMQDKTFWYRFAALGLIQPTGALWIASDVLSQMQCRWDWCGTQSMGQACSIAMVRSLAMALGDQTCPGGLLRYRGDAPGWPIVVVTLLSAAARLLVIFGVFRRASRHLFGKGLQLYDRQVWHVPRELRPRIQADAFAKHVLSRMCLLGENVHIKIIRDAGVLQEGAMRSLATTRASTPRRFSLISLFSPRGSSASESTDSGFGRRRTFCLTLCHRVLVCWHTALWGARRLCTSAIAAVRDLRKVSLGSPTVTPTPRNQPVISGARHLQMSYDLSTLRWSSNEYIFTQEILPSHGIRGNQTKLQIELMYTSPTGSPMLMLIKYPSEDSWRIWLRGLHVLMINTQTPLAQLLAFLFRAACTTQPGVVKATDLADLARFLNVDLSDATVRAEMLQAAKYNRLSSDVSTVRPKVDFHVRDFFRIVSKIEMHAAYHCTPQAAARSHEHACTAITSICVELHVASTAPYLTSANSSLGCSLWCVPVLSGRSAGCR